jgi:hypothetical protein
MYIVYLQFTVIRDVPETGAVGMKPAANIGMATARRRLQHFIILQASNEDGPVRIRAEN